MRPTMHGSRSKHRVRTLHYQSFFFPLDFIGNWNRIYGPGGMVQYQCVLPGADGRDAMREMLRTIAHTGNGSFLAVLKVFGSRLVAWHACHSRAPGSRWPSISLRNLRCSGCSTDWTILPVRQAGPFILPKMRA